MSSKIVKEEKATITLEVAAEKEAWKQAQAKAFQKVKASLKLKGFRDGKSIPDELARPHINKADVYNEGINLIIEPLFKEALDTNKVVPFMQPDVNITKVDDDNLEITFEVPVAPEVKLGSYKGHKVALNKVEVNEDEVKAEIEGLLKRSANLVTVERAAKLGDTVVLDFEGFIDGKAFDGGSAKEYSLELGSNSFVPGFEEQLVGTKAGENKDVNVKFPEQYVKELAGRDAIFKCVIKEVKEKVTPELNDEFAKSLGIANVGTVEELKANKKEELLKKKNDSAANEQYNNIVKEIVSESSIEVAPKIVEKEAAAMKENMIKQVEQNGLSFDQYLEITKTDVKALEADLAKQAEENIKTVVVLNKIAELEKLTVTEEELNKELENIGEQYHMSAEDVKKALADNLDRVRENILHKKIEEFIKANNQ